MLSLLAKLLLARASDMSVVGRERTLAFQPLDELIAAGIARKKAHQFAVVARKSVDFADRVQNGLNSVLIRDQIGLCFEKSKCLGHADFIALEPGEGFRSKLSESSPRVFVCLHAETIARALKSATGQLC